MTKQISSDLSVVIDKLTGMTKHASHDLSVALDKLANDDDFREHVLGDPVSAFSSIGIALDPSQVPAARSLPSKGSIVADQSLVQSKLEGTGRMVLFLLSGPHA